MNFDLEGVFSSLYEPEPEGNEGLSLAPQKRERARAREKESALTEDLPAIG